MAEPLKGWQDRKTLTLRHKQELMQLEQQVKIASVHANIKALEKGQANEFELDKIAMNNMERSWKDEFILAVFIVPMLMAFVPSLSAYALNGFAVIKEMPVWYTSTIIGMVVVVYGMRGMLTKYLGGRGKAWK